MESKVRMENKVETQNKERPEYESPEIVDYGSLVDLTEHQPHGSEPGFPLHAGDPHHPTFSS